MRRVHPSTALVRYPSRGIFTTITNDLSPPTTTHNSDALLDDLTPSCVVIQTTSLCDVSTVAPATNLGCTGQAVAKKAPLHPFCRPVLRDIWQAPLVPPRGSWDTAIPHTERYGRLLRYRCTGPAGFQLDMALFQDAYRTEANAFAFSAFAAAHPPSSEVYGRALWACIRAQYIQLVREQQDRFVQVAVADDRALGDLAPSAVQNVMLPLLKRLRARAASTHSIVPDAAAIFGQFNLSPAWLAAMAAAVQHCS